MSTDGARYSGLPSKGIAASIEIMARLGMSLLLLSTSDMLSNYYLFGKRSIVIQLEIGSANRYKDLANAYSSKKEHDRAIAVYTKAIQFQKMNPKLYDGRGLVYSTAGKHRLAKKDYDMADALRKYGIGR